MNIEDARVYVVSGARGWPQPKGLGAIDRIIQPREFVYLDIHSVRYNGYRSCYYRKLCVSKRPTDKQKDWYKQSYDWLYGALEEVKPGATAADAAR